MIVRDGVRVGALCTVDEAEAVFLSEIVVHPDHQGQGVGSAAIALVLSDARAREVPVRLQVLRKNRARALYERLGFRTYGETEIHFLMRRGVFGA